MNGHQQKTTEGFAKAASKTRPESGSLPRPTIRQLILDWKARVFGRLGAITERLARPSLKDLDSQGPLVQRTALAKAPEVASGMLLRDDPLQSRPANTEPYSMSLLAAISQQEVMAIQLVDGGVDASVFDNFIYELLTKVRADRRNDRRPVILFMDNATIHR